jgi:5,10-methylenetetrahydromethanopterin reductase
MVEFGLLFIPNMTISRLVHLSKIAEQSHFKYIWIADEDFYRDVYVAMSAIAVGTSKVFIGPGCTNPYTRHPVTTAIAMASLQELSGGRAVFAVGSGGLNLLNPLQIKLKKPLKSIKEFVHVFKSLDSKKETSFDGETIKIKNVRLSFPFNKVPVYIACRGPKMLKLAGEIANGVLLGSVPAEYVKIAREYIEKGLEASQEKGYFDVANSIIFSVADTRKEAFQMARPYLVYSMAVTPTYVLESVDISPRDIKPIFEALPDEKKASEKITDEMIEKFAIAGTPAECLKKVKKHIAAGVTQLVCSAPIGKKIEKAIEILGKTFLKLDNGN